MQEHPTDYVSIGLTKDDVAALSQIGHAVAGSDDPTAAFLTVDQTALLTVVSLRSEVIAALFGPSSEWSTRDDAS